MGKRFTDTDIWTKKKWFMKLEPKYKLFWFYLKDNCDAVGVWDENIELANFIIQYKYNTEEILEALGKQIRVLDNGKWWITDFCDFQYGTLSEESGSKPVQSYIALLKRHTLWIDYTKGIHTLKEKEKEKVKDKVKDKVKEKEEVVEKIKYGELVHLTEVEYNKLIERDGKYATDWMIDCLSNYKLSNGKKYKSDYGAINSWVRDRYSDKHPKSVGKSASLSDYNTNT